MNEARSFGTVSVTRSYAQTFPAEETHGYRTAKHARGTAAFYAWITSAHHLEAL